MTGVAALRRTVRRCTAILVAVTAVLLRPNGGTDPAVPLLFWGAVCYLLASGLLGVATRSVEHAGLADDAGDGFGEGEGDDEAASGDRTASS